MKRLTTLLFIFLSTAFLSSATLSAQSSGFGLGVMVGEPTGISFKNWTGSNTAISGGATWSFSGQDAIHLHADFIKHQFGDIKVENGQLPWYFGLGARVALQDESKVGARVPVGLNYMVSDAPLDIFVEIVPMLNLLPDVEFEAGGSLGVRYYF
jgi:hypothetical protein